MRKTLTVILLGASWALLAGCEQRQDSLPPADGLPQNETPRSEPDVQIGRSDRVDPGEPVRPAAPGGAEPLGGEPAGGGGDVGGAGEPPRN